MTLGKYKICAQCGRFEHHKLDTSPFCEKCASKLKKEKRKGTETIERGSILY